jgi:hypothetical protein
MRGRERESERERERERDRERERERERKSPSSSEFQGDERLFPWSFCCHLFEYVINIYFYLD